MTLWRRMFHVLALTMGCAGSVFATTTLHVTDFGATGDGKTGDGPAICRALDAAVACEGPATVVFEPRTYRIAPRYDRWCALVLSNARDVTIAGNGATLLLHPDNRALLIHQCAGISVSGFTVDFDPLPFTQGDVVAIDAGKKEIVLRIQEGFPLPGGALGRHGAFIAEGEHRFTHHWFYIGGARCVDQKGRLYALHGAKGHEDRAIQTQVGQRFVFPVVYTPGPWPGDSRFIVSQEPESKGVCLSNPAATFQVRFSHDCTFEDITLHSSPGMSFRLTGTRNVTLRRIRLTYRPGSGRLMVGASDGMHCKNNVTGPIIEDCLFEGLLDDSINISTMSEDIMERVSDNEFITQYSDIAWYDSSVSEGDTLLVFDPVKAEIVDEVRAEKVEFLSSHRRRVTVARALRNAVDAGEVGRERCTRFFIKKQAPAVVRNCSFRSQMKTAAVLRTPVLFDGNRVEWTAYGVHATNSARFGEGPIPCGQVYRGNSFTDCWIGGIVLGRYGAAGPVTPSGGPVSIEDNRFEQGPGHGVSLTNMAKVRLSGNRFTMRPDADLNLRALQMRSCAEIVVEDCRFAEPRAQAGGAILAEGMPPEAVRLHGNSFELAEGVGQAEYR